MISTRICFLVNGLGMGNSTRCHAVIQRLRTLGADIDVVTSGNGLKYFEGQPEIDKLFPFEELFYGSKNGQISMLRTVRELGAYNRIIQRNKGILTKILSNRRPDVVVTDSIYVLGPMKKLDIPIAAINNADNVVHAFYRFNDVPRSVYPQFLTVEQLDFLFHRLFPDLVLSTTLQPSDPPRRGKFLSVGPLVREGYEPSAPREKVERALIMLSGSVFGSPVSLKNSNYDCQIDVVGREGAAENAKIRFHGKLMNNRAFVEGADVAVINGGFSAVSEMFYLRKPVVIVPVPRHSEQWINARRMQELGVGLIAEESGIDLALREIINDISTYREAYKRLPSAPDGAMQAAQAIIELVRVNR